MTPWLLTAPSVTKVGIRLFCFPYAGGGASFFRKWQEKLPDWIDVCPVQFPGRENRLSEPLITRFDELVNAASRALAPYFDQPFVLFGHSLGARIAFELARDLRRTQGSSTCLLIASGSRAPHIHKPEPVRHLSDDEFLCDMRRCADIPETIMQSRAFLEMFLPVIRADFTMDETYVYSEEVPLDCPVCVFCGTKDLGIGKENGEAWALHTEAEFSLKMFVGDHFFLNSAQPFLLRVIRQLLLKYRPCSV